MIHGLAVRSGIERDLLVSTALTDMYSKCGEVTDAGVIFNQMRIGNVVSWNSMIIGYSQNGLENDALALYETMLKNNVQPDDIYLCWSAFACSHFCLVEEGRKYFCSTREKFRMEPSLDHYACMINLLGRAGRMEESVDMIKRGEVAATHIALRGANRFHHFSGGQCSCEDSGSQKRNPLFKDLSGITRSFEEGMPQ